MLCPLSHSSSLEHVARLRASFVLWHATNQLWHGAVVQGCELCQQVTKLITKYQGLKRVNLLVVLTQAAYNLTRMRSLATQASLKE
jgi:hypothetical protein